MQIVYPRTNRQHAEAAEAESLGAELDPSGQRVVTLAGDATKSADSDAAVTRAQQQFGGIDFLVTGAGLYLDNEVGSAGSTGVGELNLLNLSSALIVEGMRRGLHPKDAIMEVCKTIATRSIMGGPKSNCSGSRSVSWCTRRPSSSLDIPSPGSFATKPIVVPL